MLELKREIFGVVDRAAPAHALLATQHVVAPGRGDRGERRATPARLVGMHFFNPVHVMKLVEVVRHRASDPAMVAPRSRSSSGWARRRSPSTDSPGFASSRLGLVIGLEAMRMVEQGVASPADIDTAMKLGYGHPMGPLELTDLVGLDVRLGIAEYLATRDRPRASSRRDPARQGRRRQARQEDRRGLLPLVRRRQADRLSRCYGASTLPALTVAPVSARFELT